MNHPIQNDSELDMTDPLVMRLSQLDLPLPPGLIPETLATVRRPARRAWRRATVALAAAAVLIGGNIAAAYVSPRYAQVLAAAPGAGALTGPILQQAGLASTGAQPLDVRATDAGYTVHVFGAYADAIRTTVFVQILTSDGSEAPDGTEPADVALTDQFGHSYAQSPAFGMPVMQFNPLVWPATQTGARLTLHIAGLTTPQSNPGAVTKSAPSDSIIHGTWNLGFTVTAAGGEDLALPAPVHVGDTDYVFTTVRATPSLLEIRWTITGGAVARQQSLAEKIGPQLHNGTPPPDLAVQQQANARYLSTGSLTGRDGKTISPIEGFGHTVRQDGKDVAMVMDAWFPVAGHGSYRFQVSDLAGPQDIRIIDVP